MNKSTIIVLFIGIIVLIAIILIPQSLTKTRENLEGAREVANQALEEAVLKENVMKVSLILEDWFYENDQNYSGILENEKNSKKIAILIQNIKNNRGYEIEHFIYSAKNDYVIKMKIADAEKFYCLDSSLSSPLTISVDINKFNAEADCGGVLFK